MPIHTVCMGDCRPLSSYSASASSETCPATDLMGQLRRREYHTRQQLHLQMHRRHRQLQLKSSTRRRSRPRPSRQTPSANSSTTSLSLQSGHGDSSFVKEEPKAGKIGSDVSKMTKSGSSSKGSLTSQPMTISYSFPGAHPVPTGNSSSTLATRSSPGMMEWITSMAPATSSSSTSSSLPQSRAFWERASREIAPPSTPAATNEPSAGQQTGSQSTTPSSSSTSGSSSPMTASSCKALLHATRAMGLGGVMPSTEGTGAETRGGVVGGFNSGRRMSTPVLSTNYDSMISTGSRALLTTTTAIHASLNENGRCLQQRNRVTPFVPSSSSTLADSDTDSDMMSGEEDSEESESEESEDSDDDYGYNRGGRSNSSIHRINGLQMDRKDRTTLRCYFDHSSGRKNRMLDLVMSRVPLILKEYEYDLEGYDKVFAVTWLNDDEVLMGTKCDKMLILNVRTNRRLALPKLEDAILEPSDVILERLSHVAHAQGLNIPAIKKARASDSSNHTPRSPQGTANNSGSYGAGPNSSSNNTNSSGGFGITHRLASSLERGLRFFDAGRRSSTPSFSNLAFGLNALSSSFSGASPTGTSSLANQQPTPNPLTVAMAAPMPATPAEAANAGGEVTNNQNALINSLGVRSLSINPSRTMLAVGSGEPFQVTIYSVPELEPLGVLYGHADLVFSLKWVSDSVLVSGSRDGSFCVWKVSANGMGSRLSSGASVDSYGVPLVPDLVPALRKPIQVYFPELVRQEEGTRVRDLAYSQRTGQLMTLATEGYVKLWDRDTYTQITKLKLIHTTETVCLASNSEANLFAVGSQSHISVIDPRVPTTSNGGVGGIVHIADSCDEGWGVRSLDFKSHIITSGGGAGRLSFYDLRAQRYMEGSESGECKARYREIGRGWLNRELAYENDEAIYDILVKNAVYSMEYSEAGTRLFAAGGPLQISLSGTYAGLWH